MQFNNMNIDYIKRDQSRIKDKRILLERVEKFTSPVYFSDINLYSRLYPERRDVEQLLHYFQDNSKGTPPTFKEAVQAFSVISGSGNGKGIERKHISFSKDGHAKVGQSFGPAWSTHWFMVTFHIPYEWYGKEVRFRWNSSSEAMVWMDGKPVQGLSGDDHQLRTDFIISSNATGGKSYTLYVEMAANGMFGAGKDGLINPPDPNKTFTLKMAEIAVYSKETFYILRDLDILIGMAKDLPEDDPMVYQYLSVANKAVDCFQPETLDSYKRAKDVLWGIFSAKNTDIDFSVTSLGNCHIDSAWLWPYRETRRKCGRSWISSVNIAKEYPDFKFAISQAQQLAWVKEDYPSLYSDLQILSKGRQLNLVGGTWVEMDGNLPSGESFVRQFLYGQQFFREEFGEQCKVFWLPDTFGYSAQLPQIMREAGIKYFLTQKLSWNLINKFPHSTFLWEGLDGSRCLTHFPPADTYESDGKPADVLKTMRSNKDRGVVQEGMLLYGFGDGGGGPTAEMVEKLKRMDSLKGLPSIQFKSADDFFTNVEVDHSESLHTWKGELYLELHQGTLTTHAKEKTPFPVPTVSGLEGVAAPYGWKKIGRKGSDFPKIKQQNRRCEFALRNAEFISSLCWTKGCPYPSAELDKAWKKLLLNQFHDVLPGTSIEMVYDDVWKYYKEIHDSTEKVAVESMMLSVHGESKESRLIANSFSWDRKQVMQIGDQKSEVAAKRSRNDSVTQMCSDGAKLGMVSVPAMSLSRPSIVVDIGQLELTYTNDSFAMENKYVAATFDASGRMMTFRHKPSGREVLCEHGNQLVLFDDIPLFWDAWDVMPYYKHARYPITSRSTKKSFSVVEHGQLRVAVEIFMQVGANSKISQTISLDADSPYVKFTTKVDWHENRKLLRVEFPTTVMAEYATYDIQFGNIRRPTHSNTSWDEAKFEVCGHKWADLSEYDFGVALLSDSKYGYSVSRNILSMSLLRSPKAPDQNADMGMHEFSYAIMPHAGSFQQARVIQEAYNFNFPLSYINGVPQKDVSFDTCFNVSNPAVIIEAVKKAERKDALVLRLYECFGSTAPVYIQSSFNVERMIRCDILENPLPEDKGGNLWNAKSGCHLVLKPYQIVSLLVYLR